MKKLILVVFLFATYAFAQTPARYDMPALMTTPQQVPTGSLPNLMAITNATIAICGYPATLSNGMCTNTITTYSDSTLTTACPSTAQLTSPGSTVCISTTGLQGNLGFWYDASAQTHITYTVKTSWGTFGPYDILQFGNGGGSVTPPGSNTQMIFNNAGRFGATSGITSPDGNTLNVANSVNIGTPLTQQNQKIAGYCDSLTFGYEGLQNRGDWPSMLQSDLGVTVVNNGIGAQTSTTCGVRQGGVPVTVTAASTGVGSITGISGTLSGTGTVTLSGFNNGCSQTTATANLSSGAFSSASVTIEGTGCTAPPTTATCASGTATCSGTVTITSALDPNGISACKRIPCGTASTVTFPANYNPLNSNGPLGGVSGFFGGVHINCTYVSANVDTCFATNYTPGTATTGDQFIPDTPNAGAYQVLWEGRNDYGNQAQIISDLTNQIAVPVATGAAVNGVLTLTSTTTGTLAPGMAITGTGIAANTTIVSGSGAVWNISPSQTFSSTTITGSSAPNALILSIINAATPSEAAGQAAYNSIVADNAAISALPATYPNTTYLDIRRILVNSSNPADPGNVIDAATKAQDVPQFWLHANDGQGYLAAAMDSSTTSFSVNLSNSVILQTGDLFAVGTELMIINTYNSSTGTGTVTRCILGTTCAAHAINDTYIEKDPLHLSADGYRIVADAVAHVIQTNAPWIQKAATFSNFTALQPNWVNYFGSNLGVGPDSLPRTTYGQNNVLMTIGGSSLTSGSGNLLLGHGTGLHLTSGGTNTCGGQDGMEFATTVSGLTCWGANTLTVYTGTGPADAYGSFALGALVDGTFDYAAGNLSQESNVHGSNNTSVGESSFQNYTASNGTCIGAFCGNAAQTGNGITGVGAFFMRYVTGSSSGDVGLGGSACQFASDGTTHITSATNSGCFGNSTEMNANGDTNEWIFGTSAVGRGSNTFSFGNTAVTDAYFNGQTFGLANVHVGNILSTGTLNFGSGTATIVSSDRICQSDGTNCPSNLVTSGTITIAPGGTSGTLSTSAAYCVWSPANANAMTDVKTNGAFGAPVSGGVFTLTLGAAASGSDVFAAVCR